jgi:tripartite ATP-independent transporter DctM subunit
MARVVRTVGMVMMLIGFAAAFGYMMALMQLPAKITQFFLSVSDNKYIILLLINIILLMLGCLMDMAPLIVICTPILLPVAVSIGIDPVHFGMILLVNLGMGLITPPVGATLFVGCAVGRVPISEMVRTIWPFYLAMLVVLALVTYVPAISMWLPSMLKL